MELEPIFSLNTGNKDPLDGYVERLVALDARHAVALVEGDCPRLWRAENGAAELVDLATLLPDLGSRARFEALPLFGVGEGFGIVFRETVLVWSSFDATPIRRRIVPGLIPGRLEFVPLVERGGKSDDLSCVPFCVRTDEVLYAHRAMVVLDLRDEGRWLAPFSLSNDDVPNVNKLSLEQGALIDDVAFHSGRFHVMSIGNSSSYVKYGMDWSLVGRLDADHRLKDVSFFEEDSHGAFASDGRLIVSPLRGNGPSKGRPSMLDLSGRTVEPIWLRKTLRGGRVLDFRAGTAWVRHKGEGGEILSACVARA